VPPANDSDTPTAQFGLLLLGLLLFTSLLILIIVVQH
jgi:hypothetical protein